MLRKQLSVLDRRFNGKITSTAKYMKKKGFDLKAISGHGTFGSVVKMGNSKDSVAVKIIDRKPIVFGELNIWRTLDHPNILKLISAEYISCVGSFIFVMSVFPTTLKEILLEK